MEFSGLVAEKFCHKLSPCVDWSNKLILPPAFVSKYGNRLDDSMELRVRNGYVLPVHYDRCRGLLKGLAFFLKSFDLKGGDLLLFEYLGRSNINVYIIGTNCCEIHYPQIRHPLKDYLPPKVTLGDGGLRFISYNTGVDRKLDEIEPPEAFLARCESTLTDPIKYVMSNGKMFFGSYCPQSKKFLGFSRMCAMLGVPDFTAYHMFLFSYEGNSVMTISAFDEELYEIVFPGTPLSIEGNSYFPSVGSYFQITVEEKHLNDECFAVEISNEYKWLCNQWRRSQSIKVYSGEACWMLDLRKRDDYYRYTIEDGWRIFRDGLRLNVGDICVFECASQSYDQFSVRVVRSPSDEED